jgi:hypothetical protein
MSLVFRLLRRASYVTVTSAAAIHLGLLTLCCATISVPASALSAAANAAANLSSAGVVVVATSAAPPVPPPQISGPGYCVYNRTRASSVSLAVAVGARDFSSFGRPLSPGGQFCCPTTDETCGGIPTTSSPIHVAVRADTSGQALRCGTVAANAGAANAGATAAVPGAAGWAGAGGGMGASMGAKRASTPSIAITARDSYLLVRDGNAASAPATPPPQSALSVDLMASDGRVIASFPCRAMV